MLRFGKKRKCVYSGLADTDEPRMFVEQRAMAKMARRIRVTPDLLSILSSEVSAAIGILLNLLATDRFSGSLLSQVLPY